MARIEGFRVKNFKVLGDVTLGRLWNQRNRNRAPLTPMAAVIGKNGVGKSALVDAFGFLADTLTLGAEEACDARGRGGFSRLRTLLEDPAPPPFLCIEEPENGVYHKLLEILATEFREHAARGRGSQVFITTHQPYFVNSLNPEEVWILEKGADGQATVRRASDDPVVTGMVAEGLPLGGLWYSEYLG